MDLVSLALELLSSKSLRILQVSKNYNTPAFPPGSGPNFVNGAVQVETSLSPQKLLEHLHWVEQELGRTRKTRWAARVIDLDLLDYGGKIAPDPDGYQKWRELPLADQMTQTPELLILPHPRIQDRPFVLVPIRDVAPNWVHPVSGETVDQLIATFGPDKLAEIRPMKSQE